MSRSAAQSLRLLVPISHLDTQPSPAYPTTSSRTRSLTKTSDPGPSALFQTLTTPGDATATGIPVSPFPFTLDDTHRTSLFRLLFPSAVDDATLFTPHTVYTRYEEVKRVHGPSYFTNQQLTALVNILATCKRTEQAGISASMTPTHWRQVLEIGDDKRRAGYAFVAQDRYWLMHACIAETLATQSASTQLQHIEEAAEHCAHLFSNHDANIQFTSLSAFFASPAFTDTLHETVPSSPSLSAKVTQLFWALVERGSSLDSRFRARLCALAVRNSQRRQLHTIAFPIRPLNVCDVAHIIMTYIGFSTLHPPTHPDIHSWIRQQVVDTLGSRIDPVARWHHLRQAGGFVEPVPELTQSMMNPSWGAIFELASPSCHHSVAGEEACVRTFTLWDCWTTECTRYAPNRVIAQIITSAFLRTARMAHIPDVFSLFAGYCEFMDLWMLPPYPSRFDQVQALDSIFAFISSQAGLVPWTDLFDFVTQHTSHLNWREKVTDKLLRHYTITDPQLAHSLVRFATRHSTPLPSSSLLALAERLAGQRQWILLRPLLAPSYDIDQTERLVQRCLRTIQVHRLERVNDVVAQWLLRRIAALYRDRQPPRSMKYPLRYFLGAAMKSGFVLETVALLRTTCSAFPSLFSPSFARRLVLSTLQLGHRNISFELYAFFSSILPRSAVEDIRRKVSHCLIAKSRKFAHRYTVGRPPYQPEHANRRQRPLRKQVPLSTRLRPAIDASQDIAVIRQSLNLLVRDGRLHAARKVLYRISKDINPKDCTTLGNVILHGSLLQYRQRGRHRMRHVLNTKAFLEEHCHFAMDRATINILLKAMLQWVEYFDAQRARFLFDQLVHEGYPIPDRFRDGRPHGVPFGHAHDPSLWNGGQGPPSTPSIFSKLPPCVSFPRHMRPMLKMFIKAFYIRKDIIAAKTVVGILKDAEAAERAEREKRNRARREGIIKKHRKTSDEKSRRESDSLRPQ